MTKTITVTDMARALSDIIGQVYYKHETFHIKKGTNIVATLSPTRNRSTIAISNLNDFFKSSPHLDKSDIADFQKDLKHLKLLQDDGGLNKWE